MTGKHLALTHRIAEMKARLDTILSNVDKPMYSIWNDLDALDSSIEGVRKAVEKIRRELKHA